MSGIYVEAKHDRRRGNHSFAKGKNGPFKADHFTSKQWQQIEADPVLTVVRGKSDKSGKAAATGKKAQNQKTG